MRKSLLFVVATFCSISILASTYAGYCGPKGNRQSLTWFLDTETGVLTIRGNGEELEIPNADRWNEHGEYITSITIPDQVKRIGDYVFSGCSKVSSITLPSNLTEIGQYAFNGCTLLKSIQIPNTVTRIGVYAFHNCTSLSSIVIPNKVTYIRYALFNGCTNLRSVALSNNVEEIDEYVFKDCKSLNQIKIPINCSKIGRCAFENCCSLNSSFFIPLSVREIGSSAFLGCTSIKKFYYPFGLSISDIGLNEQTVNFQVYMEIPDEFADYYGNATNDDDDNTVYSVPETLPEYSGGMQAMMRYLSENVKYPPIAAENGIQGKAVCSFVINKDGSVSDVEIIRSAGDPSLDKEAIRVIKSMPKWKPGTIKGKPVRVKLSAPVKFSLY